IEADGMTRVDRPATIELTHRSAAPVNQLQQVSVAGPSGTVDTIPMARDPFDPGHWSGRFWPKEIGWHSIQIGSDRRTSVRVSGAEEWEGLDAAARLRATMKRAGAGHAPAEMISPFNLRLLLFAGLLVAITYLWLESRSRG